MSENRFQHVDMRVSDLDAAIPFYSALLPALGFFLTESSPDWRVFQAEGEPPAAPFFSITEAKDHRPNANRVAFWAANPKEVDRLTAVAREAGARNISGPRACPEYSSSYYASFFEDPCGNCLEICYQID